MENFIDDVILEISTRLPCGGAYLDFGNEDHLVLLETVLREKGVEDDAINDIARYVAEKSSKKEDPEDNSLSTEDVDVLKKFGLNLRSMDDYNELDIEGFYAGGVYFDRAKNAKGIAGSVFGDKMDKIPYIKVKSYIISQDSVNVMYGKTFTQVVTFDGMMICRWGLPRPTAANDENFNRSIAMFQLYKSYPEKFAFNEYVNDIYEVDRVDELNGILAKSATPLNLYFSQTSTQEQPSRDIDMHVKVKSSEKIKGTGKADIALRNEDGHEVFWISYKHGNVFGKGGQLLASVPINQYGMLQKMYDDTKSVTSSDDISNLEVQKVVNAFMNKIVQFPDIADTKVLGVTNIDIDKTSHDIVFSTAGGEKVIPPRTKVYDHINNADVYPRIKTAVDKQEKVNLYFFLQGVKDYYWDMTDETDVLNRSQINTIIGKSVYGTDFYPGNETFGRENANVLLQTKNKLIVKHHKIDDMVDGVIIGTDEYGHVLMNPNLPTELTLPLEEVVNVYSPILCIRHTKPSYFRWENSEGVNIVFGARLVITPKGNITGTANRIEI